MGHKDELPARDKLPKTSSLRIHIFDHPAITAFAGRYLRQGGFAHNVTILAGGTAIGQAVVVLSSPILTRLYSPSSFGILAVYVSLLSFLLGIASWRYHMAIPLAESNQSVASLLVLCFALLLGMALVLVLAIALRGAAIVAWTNTPALAPFLWLLPLSYLGAGAFQLLTAWAIRTNEFGKLARSKLGQSAGQALTQVAFGVVLSGPVGLLIGDAIGRTAGSMNLARQMWAQLRDDFRTVSAGSVLQIGIRYKRFPLISSVAGFISSAGDQIPTLLIASLYGPTIVGWFGLVQRLLSMSFVLVASAIGTVFLSESARLAQQDPQRLLNLFWKTATRASLIASILFIGVVLTTPLLFGPLFGSQWSGAARFAQILAFPASLQFVNRSVGSAAIIVERQDLDFAGECISTLSASAAVILAKQMDASPMTCIVMLSVGLSVGCLSGLLLSWYAIHSVVRQQGGIEEKTAMEVQAQ